MRFLGISKSIHDAWYSVSLIRWCRKEKTRGGQDHPHLTPRTQKIPLAILDAANFEGECQTQSNATECGRVSAGSLRRHLAPMSMINL